MKKPDETITPTQNANLTSEALLLAILTLLIDERERSAQADSDAIKTELLLASAGLNNRQIAAMMNKSPDAVRKMLARAQAATKGSKSEGK